MPRLRQSETSHFHFRKWDRVLRKAAERILIAEEYPISWDHSLVKFKEIVFRSLCEKLDGNGLLSLIQENKSVAEYDEEFTLDKVFILSMMKIVIPECSKNLEFLTNNINHNKIVLKLIKFVQNVWNITFPIIVIVRQELALIVERGDRRLKKCRSP